MGNIQWVFKLLMDWLGPSIGSLVWQSIGWLIQRLNEYLSIILKGEVNSVANL